MKRALLWIVVAAASLLAGCRQLDCVNAALAHPRDRCVAGAVAGAPGWENS